MTDERNEDIESNEEIIEIINALKKFYVKLSEIDNYIKNQETMQKKIAEEETKEKIEVAEKTEVSEKSEEHTLKSAEDLTNTQEKKEEPKLLQAIKFYHIPLYAALLIAVIIASVMLTNCVKNLPNVLEDPNKYTVWINLIPIGLLIAYGIITYYGIQGRIYLKKTGRSLSVDKGKYKRSYYQLLEYFAENKKKEMNVNDLPLISWKNAEGMILGKTKDGRLINVESGKNGLNYMIFGLPGIGKTAGPIICSALRFGVYQPLKKEQKLTEGSVFCIDIKGDIWQATHEYRNIKCFNLMDVEKSCCFNPFDGVADMGSDEKCNYIENIGFNIIQLTSEGESRYFTDTAYDFWNGIVLQMLHDEPKVSFPKVVDSILKSNPQSWIDYVVNQGCDEAKRRLANKKGENEKNLAGGYSNLCQNIRKFTGEKMSKLLDNGSDKEFISPQMLEDGYDIYLQLDQSELANYAPLISMIVQSFFTGFIKRELNPNAGRTSDGHLRPILMLLDEFAQLRTLKYESVATAFMTLRSKNISIACALQSRSSLVEVYKTENACSALIDCVTTFCFLGIQEVSTREWASKLIGNNKVLKLSNSLNAGEKGRKNAGQTVNEAEEPIFEPSVFGNLVDREHGRDEVIIYSAGKYIKADKVYYFQD